MRLLKGLAPGLPLAFFAFLLAEPAFTAETVLQRTVFFLCKVFPTLFPALCLSGMLAESPWAEKLYRLPLGAELTVWVLGMLCGFPVGAKCAFRLYEGGRITKRRAELLCAFSSLASTPFLLGVVGSSLFGDPAFGWLLAALQGVSSLLTAGILYTVFRPGWQGVLSVGRGNASFLSRITSATRTAGEVGGMLIFFGTAADCLDRLGGLEGKAGVLVTSLLEFSAGCGKAAELGEGGKLLAVLAVGFSGLCVLGQVSAVTKGKLSLLPYLGGKLIHTALMGVLFLTVTG